MKKKHKSRRMVASKGQRVEKQCVLKMGHLAIRSNTTSSATRGKISAWLAIFTPTVMQDCCAFLVNGSLTRRIIRSQRTRKGDPLLRSWSCAQAIRNQPLHTFQWCLLHVHQSSDQNVWRKSDKHECAFRKCSVQYNTCCLRWQDLNPTKVPKRIGCSWFFH